MSRTMDDDTKLRSAARAAPEHNQNYPACGDLQICEGDYPHGRRSGSLRTVTSGQCRASPALDGVVCNELQRPRSTANNIDDDRSSSAPHCGFRHCGPILRPPLHNRRSRPMARKTLGRIHHGHLDPVVGSVRTLRISEPYNPCPFRGVGDQPRRCRLFDWYVSTATVAKNKGCVPA